jgi:hypothetical protein
MKVSELIAILQTMPQDVVVEVNDNNGGEVYGIHSVDHFTPNTDLWPDDYESVVIQVNVELGDSDVG